MNKKLLSERDICTKFISPAIESAGWNKQTQYLEEVLTKPATEWTIVAAGFAGGFGSERGRNTKFSELVR